MKLLIIGSKGQLGQELTQICQKSGFDFSETDLPETDISNVSQVDRLFSRHQPAIAVNAAAYTAVDKAESDQRTCFAVNRDGPMNLARTSAKHRVPLIHISTDYVFDGKGEIPYKEDDPVSPIGVYGTSKANGEIAIRRLHRQHVIIRTAWMYGVFGNNFVKTMLRVGRERQTLNVVDDQYGCPTCAADLANAILAVCDEIGHGKDDGWGTYHFCGKGITTWYEFAKAVFENAERLGMAKTPVIVPVGTSQYPTAAKRPAFSALDCSKIETAFGIRIKPWPNSLKSTVEEIASRWPFAG